MATDPEDLTTIGVSSILSALSYALDLTEGHPRGHSARSCLIGMALGRVVCLSPQEQQDLFYALLMKDAGCSSNVDRVFKVFGGDDQAAKRGAWEQDWRTLRGKASYALKFAEPGGSIGAPESCSRSPQADARSGVRSTRFDATAAPRSRRPSDSPAPWHRRFGAWTSTGTEGGTPKG